jgi:hypothetical protein
VKHASSPLDELIAALVEAMVDAHTGDPELFTLLARELPHGAGGPQDFAPRLHGVFRLAVSSKAPELEKCGDLDKVVFVVANMVESLSHAATLRRPSGVSLVEAKAEAVKAVIGYLREAVDKAAD